MRILITGDRNWTSADAIRSAFYELVVPYWSVEEVVVIEGCAKGADTLCYKFAKSMGYKTESYPAEWKAYGKAAGPIRNKRMLDDGKPQIVIAFHDDLSQSKGTKNMVEQAIKIGLPVVVVNSKGEWSDYK